MTSRPRLALWIVTLVVALLVGAVAAAPAQAKQWRVPSGDVVTSTSTTVDRTLFAEQVVVDINRERTAAGLAPVRYFDSCVSKVARRWARKLARRGTFEHRDQTKVLRRCHQSWAGEALIRGEGLTPEAAVSAWMASPSHREVLLKSRASLVGIFFATDTDGRMVGTLNFTDKR